MRNSFYYEVLMQREKLANEISGDVHYQLGNDSKKENEIKKLNQRLRTDKSLWSKIL